MMTLKEQRDVRKRAANEIRTKYPDNVGAQLVAAITEGTVDALNRFEEMCWAPPLTETHPDP